MSYIHLSYREPTDYTFYNQVLNFSNFVMDRSFLDEVVYAPVFKRTLGMTEEEIQTLIQKLNDLGIKLFIFECSDEELSKRILKRTNEQDEEAEVLENLKYIKEQYRNLAKKYNIKIIDTTNKSYADLRYEIMEE